MGAFSIAEAKAQFSALVEMAESGAPVTITKRGIPVAKLVPLSAPPEKPKLNLDELRAFRATLPVMKTSSVTLVRQMRDGEIQE